MYKIIKYSNVGGRSENEDSCEIFYEEGRLCAVVADGLGGHGGGAEASKTAVDYMGKKFLEQKEDFVSKISDNMEELNSVICSKQMPSVKMRTTIALLSIVNQEITTAHIGDTRIYHFVDCKITEVTFDHSVSQLAVLSGEIKQEEIRYHIDRNKLLRSLGKSDGIKTEINSWGKVKDGRHAFLMCSDGFWENITETEMTDCLKEAADIKEWMTKMLRIAKARMKENADNNTVIAIWCD